MLKVTLRLYRSQFAALLTFLPNPAEYSFRDSVNLYVEELVLLDYRSKVSPQQVLTWSLRPNSKRYALSLPLMVARALWSELQCFTLTTELQELLSELDNELKTIGLNL